MSDLPRVTLPNLLEAGVHFGHKVSRWNPKMDSYIHGVRGGVHIIDLMQTVPLFQIALKAMYQTAKDNGKILFVSSKSQAKEIIAECAEQCGQFYVNSRWLGGMLTNWSTVSRSIKKLDHVEKLLDSEGVADNRTKKEILSLKRSKDKLLKSLNGVRTIMGLPDLLVVIDSNHDHLAITEAKKLGIPIVSIVDTNSNPDNIDYPIPGNDDAIRSIQLYCNMFVEAVLAGIQDSIANAKEESDIVPEVNEEIQEKTPKKPKKFSKSTELKDKKSS